MPLCAPEPLPRFSRGPLPPYRYVPGRTPHPRRDPAGHGHGQPEPRPLAVDPAAWAPCALYLRGIDLYNLGYWWESHEALEALWRGAGTSPAAGFFQGLIQIAAAELKREMGREGAAQALYARGLARLGRVPSPFMGVEVRGFASEVEARARGEREAPARIALEGLTGPR